MSENKALVAICDGHMQAEKAIAELQRLGFDMKQVSVISKAYVSDEEIVGCYVADGRLRGLGVSAAFWEQLSSLLGEAGLFFVPGIGPVVIAGAFVNALATTVKNAVATGKGLTLLAAACDSLGLPKGNVFRYEIEIKANKSVLIAFGTPKAQAKAKAGIEKAHAAENVISHGCRRQATGDDMHNGHSCNLTK
jgi:hypothetical protein